MKVANYKIGIFLERRKNLGFLHVLGSCGPRLCQKCTGLQKNAFNKLCRGVILKEKNRSKQGDQIGRFFAYLATVYFGYFFANYRRGPNYCATYFHGKSYLKLLPKACRAAFWPIFFTNESGRPGSKAFSLRPPR
jgi:hypothetical protein